MNLSRLKLHFTQTNPGARLSNLIVETGDNVKKNAAMKDLTSHMNTDAIKTDDYNIICKNILGIQDSSAFNPKDYHQVLYLLGKNKQATSFHRQAIVNVLSRNAQELSSDHLVERFGASRDALTLMYRFADEFPNFEQQASNLVTQNVADFKFIYENPENHTGTFAFYAYEEPRDGEGSYAGCSFVDFKKPGKFSQNSDKRLMITHSTRKSDILAANAQIALPVQMKHIMLLEQHRAHYDRTFYHAEQPLKATDVLSKTEKAQIDISESFGIALSFLDKQSGNLRWHQDYVRLLKRFEDSGLKITSAANDLFFQENEKSIINGRAYQIIEKYTKLSLTHA